MKRNEKIKILKEYQSERREVFRIAMEKQKNKNYVKYLECNILFAEHIKEFSDKHDLTLDNLTHFLIHMLFDLCKATDTDSIEMDKFLDRCKTHYKDYINNELI